MLFRTATDLRTMKNVVFDSDAAPTMVCATERVYSIPIILDFEVGCKRRGYSTLVIFNFLIVTSIMSSLSYIQCCKGFTHRYMILPGIFRV